MTRTSSLPKRLQPMLATLTDSPFDDAGWVFEDKYDGFRMVAKIEGGKVTLYSRNGKIINHSYIEVAKALEGVKGDAVIDGELVALDENGVSHFQLLQNALRHDAKLQYCAFDLMFHDEEDLRGLMLIERKKRLKEILPRHKLIAFSRHRKKDGTKFFDEAERKGLEGIMAKRSDSKYLSGARTDNWLKVKTSKRQEVVIVGFTAPKRTRPYFGALALAVREQNGWRYIGHVGTGFSHTTLEQLYSKLIKLKASKSPFSAKVKDEAVTTWVKPSLVAEVKFTEWTTKGEMRHPVYLGLRADKRAEDVTREREISRATRQARSASNGARGGFSDGG
ncbi:non-homologous end-joining DNA ligase [Bradyrhizobium sp. AUGA SZCCT0240]|uniref:non-homologous end-joining DNA ligase n=1 Tax=unclassified Bradyrhizobium TaxID=2631580 RepID=UPI001BA73DAF|nr:MULTISPECIES: non-homologous end-joining DNA ligase [unclassified Bradyrhizobium]MBR1194434.1 non-homologous end-joining DNA ligase [Bradyrhizobium sp. AUGA SZCCT0158]MBR1245102.1 non-homologous end-joining DNA ligase [Bradyrhizobium sp. AUGA SZCCT0274]MBR1252826.1 non-homologous end-joining DNA ligase [Bradyrhizobium sp. AUGA SZCCT0240]